MKITSCSHNLIRLITFVVLALFSPPALNGQGQSGSAEEKKGTSFLFKGNWCLWCLHRSWILTLLAGVLSAVGSDAPADEHQTCDQVLNGPVLKDALTRNDGRDWRAFVDSGALIGVACEASELDAYFKAGGWTIGGKSPTPPGASQGPFGPPGAEFYYDFVFGYAYCKRRSLLSLFRRKCSNSIGILMFEGRITHIHGGGNK